MKKLLVITMCALLISACSGGGSSLAVKTGGKDIKFDAKDSRVTTSVMTYTEKPTGDGVIRAKKAASCSIELVNFEPTDPSKFRPLTADGQTRIMLGIVGEENTDQNSPVKVGTYTTGVDKFMKFDLADIVTFVDGKEKSDNFNLMSSTPSAKGTVKITSVTADGVIGEVDLTDTDRSIKGTFTAKLTKK